MLGFLHGQLGHKIQKLTLQLCVFLGLLTMSIPAYAISQAEIQTVNQISNYLSSVSSLQGKFTQIAPNGHVSSGDFYIVKPGKMRFEYSPPNPYVIIADGTWVTVKNKTKKYADQYPLSATPLKMVLAKNVDLLKQAEILNVTQSDGLATVTLRDKDQFVAGELVLVFDQTLNQLQQWIVIDGKGQRTTVSISQFQNAENIDPKLFIYKKNRSKSGSNR